MLIVQIKGGLGNQMFQYAVGRAIAEKKQCTLNLDLSWFNENDRITDRIFKLDAYAIKKNIAESKDIEKIKKTAKNKIIRKVRRIIVKYSKSKRKKYIIEKNSKYDETIFNLKKDIYLEGYWQSEKYFKTIENIIRKEFEIKNKISEESAAIIKKIKNEQAVSIHIRRGDYVSNKKVAKLYNILKIDYYLKAIQIIKSKIEKPSFYIFSDDKEWAKKNMIMDENFHVIDINNSEKDYEDLIIMATCKHHIIANSSFSWWGAWLSKNSQKIVVAPAKWKNKKKGRSQDRYPEGWIRI